MHILLISSRPWSLPAAAQTDVRRRLTSLQGSLTELQPRVVASAPDLVLVRDLAQSDAVLEQLEALCAALPQAAVVLLCMAPEPAFLMRAMRAGVREVIASDADAVLLGLLARVEARLPGGRSAEAKPGRCIGVMPAKGGDGATCLVANLATAIAKTLSTRVLLVDLTLPFGDVELQLTRETATHDLADFACEIERLDGELLEVMAHHVSPNLHLIRAPQTIDKLMQIKPADVARLVRISLRHYDYVLLDMGLDAVSLNALDLLDQLIVVATLNVPSVRHAGQILRLWESLGYAASKVSLAVNRHGDKSVVQLADLEKAVGLRVRHVLPAEPDGVQDSLLQGVATIVLKPKSEFAKTITAWAAELTGQTEPEKARSLWHRFVTR